MGVAVAKTIGGIIQSGDATAHLVIAALLGAIVWEVLTWLWALPVSSSHALVGGLLGAGLAALGPSGIVWQKLVLVFASLLISPFLGIITGFLFMRASRLFFTMVRWDMARADRFYKRMQISLVELGLVQPRLQRRHQGHGHHRHLPRCRELA